MRAEQVAVERIVGITEKSLRAAITTRVAVSVRGTSCITCSGVLSSFNSRMRRSSVVLNMAKFLLVLRGPAGQRKSRLVWRLVRTFGCNFYF